MDNHCSLDTNCLLALVLPERKAQGEKVEKTLAKNVCFVSDMAISEFEFVLSKVCGFDRWEVVDTIQSIIGHKNIEANDRIIQMTLAWYKNHPALSFDDTYMMYQSKLEQATPLFTFDKKLANQSEGLAKLLA